MWRCLVEENVRAGQVSNVGCGSEHGPVVANNHKLEEKYGRRDPLVSQIVTNFLWTHSHF